ncbi:MAG: translation initiation factor IF-3 [Halofilum sp. (in: g-proteobacteria)]|nr:translation initiation factor IF-3 [Halofilum sp. (in: g-proteobacteria)]
MRGQAELANEPRVRTTRQIEHGQQVRLIGSDGEQVGVVPLEQALEAAEEAGLDLVEVVPNAEPPVCRIMDYGKFRFEQSKKKNAARKKTKQIQLKEVKFRPGTEEGDYQVKLRNLQKFLEQGDKTKVTLRFRGREMAHRDIGARLLERVQDDLSELATVEQFPKMEGRQMVMVLAPRKHEARAAAPAASGRPQQPVDP